MELQPKQSAQIACAWQHEQRHAAKLKGYVHQPCGQEWMQDVHTEYLCLGLSCGLCKGRCVACRWGRLDQAGAGGSAARDPLSNRPGSEPMCTVAPAGTHLMQRRRLPPRQMHWSRLSSWPQQWPAFSKPHHESVVSKQKN